MKRLMIVLLVAALCFGLVGVAMAGNSANHQVTVTVSSINEVSVSGGDLTLTIVSASPGSDPTSVTDSTTCDLSWTTTDSGKKITVQTSLASPLYSTLTVEAKTISYTSGSGAVAQSAVTLSGASAQDLITSVATQAATCDLAYIASTTADKGTGTDTHTTVTYTISAV